MNITSAKYLNQIIDYDKNIKENCSIKAVIDNETLFVPLDPANRHYQAIQECVKIYGNTIEEAD